MDPAALRAEILSGPLAAELAPLVAAADDAAVAALLNAPTGRGPVPIAELSAYCVRAGIVGACEAAAWHPDTPLPVKGLCFTVLSLVRDDYRLTTADVDDPAFGGACDALTAAGLMTAGQKAGLLALGAGRRSRADAAVGGPVSVYDVGCARNLGGG